MTTKPDDGGPAFPVEAEWKDGKEVWPAGRGMSLRDWFAGQALAGMLAGSPDTDWTPNGYAKDAYYYADAMIYAREHKGTL